MSCSPLLHHVVEKQTYLNVSKREMAGQGFNSVVPLPASQAQGPEFDPWYSPKKRNGIDSYTKEIL